VIHTLATEERCDNTINVLVSSLEIALENEALNLIKIDVEGLKLLH
jgi:hypothetical protein